MSLSRVKSWITNEILTSSDLNAEYNNILNYLNGSGVTLTSPTIASPTFTGTVTLPGSGSLKAAGYVFNTYGVALSTSSLTLANAGTLDLDTGALGSSFVGTLNVSSALNSDSNFHTNKSYAVQGRGSTLATPAALITGNGSGSNSFTVTMVSNGVFRITNTGGGTSTVAVSFFGNIV